MAYDVVVKISLVKPQGILSFGYPLILSVAGSSAVAYKECTSLDEVVEAGFANTTDTYKAAALMFSQPHPPAMIAVCGLTTAADLNTIANKGWRQLVIVDGESDDISAIVTYINTTTDKDFFATVVPTSGSATTGLAALGTGDRVNGFVHTDKLAAAALAGEAAGNAVGAINYKNLILNGIEPMDYTDSEITTIHEAGGFTFVTKAGDNVTTEGKAMSGEYIDIIDCKDYVIQQLTYQTQKLLNTSLKVPYTAKGISMLEAVATNVMQDCFNKGIIAADENGKPMYTVSYKKMEAIDPATKLTRKYVGGSFSLTLAGAVNEVEINGSVEI